MRLKRFIFHPNDGATLSYKGYFLYWSDGDLVVLKDNMEVANLTLQGWCESYFSMPLDKDLKRILTLFSSMRNSTRRV